ncbi:hypothetical protein CFG65_03025 [Vibrio parahaemolyticus]|nr:hypothetical protein CFG65_03025 [Vibrio parahaemolyticus]
MTIESSDSAQSIQTLLYVSVWALVDDNPIRYLGIKLGFNETK